MAAPTVLDRFAAYAADFEATFKDDDWKRLEPYFAPNARYEVTNIPFACTIEGRDAIFRGIKKSLDNFDRKFTNRKIDVTGPPEVAGDSVSIPWAVTYEREGNPPLTIRGRSTAQFTGDRITHLRDAYEDGIAASTAAWMAKHGADVDGSYV